MPRAVAFSAKAKKKQLQAKRQEKRQPTQDGEKFKRIGGMVAETGAGELFSVAKTRAINEQPGARGRNTNRYALKFYEETREEIEARKEEARQAIKRESLDVLEYGSDFAFLPGLAFPQRPPWDYSLSPQELDMKENKYFREYVDEIEKKFNRSELSYFELNLETWRQLWRVIEMSDILLVIVDARYPSLQFPPSLYDYVTSLGRSVILVLNKIDLIPPSAVAAWLDYFKSTYPQLHVICFTSLPSYNLREGQSGGLKGARRRGKMRMAAEGAEKLLQVCEKICQDKVDLASWKAKIAEELHAADDDEEAEIGEVVQVKKSDVSYKDHERFSNGVLTIGCVGQPNVGKSSLINALMGKKVVSVSKTPGHTKQFQTIFLTPNVKLCDCPGLVFPSKLPRVMQVLCGSFPIAQLREPYTTIGYLGKYLDLPKLLRLEHPSGDKPQPGEELEWSAFDLCEAWAVKRGFFTKRAARADVARAANHLLRFALEGRICLYVTPPGYHVTLEKWEKDPEIAEIRKIQALSENPADLMEEDVESEADEDAEEKSDDESSEEEEDDDEEEKNKKPIAGTTNKFTLLLEDDDD